MIDRPTDYATAQQPLPIPSNHPRVVDLLVDDLYQRSELGQRKYGTPLRPFNERNALIDLYQELLDAAAYLRQHIYERDNSTKLNKSNEPDRVLDRVQSLSNSIQFYQTDLDGLKNQFSAVMRRLSRLEARFTLSDNDGK